MCYLPNLFVYCISIKVSDVLWHSLSGLQDGMITMLADTTFGGNWDRAHTFADVGGDILGVVEWDSSFYANW